MAAAAQEIESAERLVAAGPAALMLLDLENRYLWQSEGGEALPTAALIPNLTRLLQAARARDVLRVVVSTVLDDRADSDAWRRRRVHMRKRMPWLNRHTEWGSRLAAPFEPQPDEVRIMKLRMSAFYCTNLDIYLRSRGIKVLVLAGLATNGAILAAFLEALSRDLHAFVVRDAVLGTAPELHTAALQILSEDNLIDTDAVCAAWKS